MCVIVYCKPDFGENTQFFNFDCWGIMAGTENVIPFLL